MHAEKIKLLLDKSWALEDLAVVSRGYNQLYAFAYSLSPELSGYRQNQVLQAYANLPWRGGYSTVNFFFQVFRRIPQEFRPQVTRITYASPGFIELAALAAVCFTVARIVKTVAGALITASDTYTHIKKGMQERKLSQLRADHESVEIQLETYRFCDRSCDELVRTMGITAHENEVLEQRTKGNKLMKLKLLMSVYRRAEPLAEKQALGMLDVQAPPPPPPRPPSPPSEPIV